MTVPIPLQPHFAILEKHQICPETLFTIPQTPPREKWIRSYLAPAAARLPQSLRYELTSWMKRMRHPSHDLFVRYPLDYDENRHILDDIESLNLAPWWGKKAVLCLCHDVDNAKGAAFVSQMAHLNADHHIVSTFNFLTHADYPLEQGLLKRLKQDGFEIGLHGMHHDQGLAFRASDTIRSHLVQGLEALDQYDVKGFRSPALSVSPQLYFALSDQGFVYDSSLQIASPFYSSVRLPYPFYLQTYGVWELPLMVQDDNYFRDASVPEKEVFASLKRFIDEVKRLNGICVLNMHPHIMADRMDFYKTFLAWVHDQDVAVKTCSDVINYIQEPRSHSAMSDS